MSEVGRMFVTVTANTASLATGIQSQATATGAMYADGFSKSAGAKLATLGKTIFAGIGIAAVGAGVVGLAKAGVEYENTMLKLQAVTGATKEEMQAAAQAAKDLGNDVTLPGVSAGDAAAAMTELGKAGFTVEQAMRAADGTMRLGVAGQLDMAQAAEITSNALLAFKLPAEDAAKVADMLAAGANASSADVTDMGAALSQSAAVFAAAKIPVQDLTTMIGQMANEGIKGSDAGTSLKTMLMKLQNPTEKSAAAMKKLGINLYDSEGNMRPMREVIGQVSGALEGMTQKQRDAALGTIFGTDAIRSANIVLAGGTEKFDKMSAAINKTGAANELAASTTKGLSGAIGAITSNLETMAIDLYEKVAPGITDVLRQAQPLIGVFAGIVGAIGDVLGPLLSFVAQSPAVKAALLALVGGFVAYKVAVFALQIPTMAAAAAQWALNAAMAANPIGIVIALIAALVAGIVWLYNNNETAKRIIDAVWKGIQEAVQTVVAWFQSYVWPVLKVVVDLIVGYFKMLFTVYKTVWDAIYAVVEKVVQWFMATVWPKVKTFIDRNVAAFQLLSRIVSQVFNAVMGFIQPFIDFLLGTVWPGVQKFASLWSQGFDGMKKAVSGAINFITGLVSGLVGKFLEIGGNIVQGLKDGIANAWNGLTSFFTDKINALPDMVKNFLGIHSPSRVFMQIGGNVVEGFSIGLDGLDKVNAKTADRFRTMAANSEKIINEWVDAQKKALEEAQQAWSDYQTKVYDSLSGGTSGSDAMRKTQEQQKAVQDAERALRDARAAAASGQTTQTEGNAIADAEAKLAAARAAVKSFEQNLTDSLDQSQVFGTMFQKASDALAAQFGQGSPIWTMLTQDMLAQGPVQGLELATAMQNGVSATTQEKLLGWNKWAGQVATDQANKAYGQGVADAENTLKGIGAKIRAEKDRLIGFGEKMGLGMVEGFESRIKDFEAAVGKYIAAAQRKLDINSPSKVFRAIGDSVGEGFNDGVARSVEPFSVDSIMGAPSVDAKVRMYAPGLAGGVESGDVQANVRVFIGDRELTDIVRTEVDDSQSGLARSLVLGRR